MPAGQLPLQLLPGGVVLEAAAGADRCLGWPPAHLLLALLQGLARLPHRQALDSLHS